MACILVPIKRVVDYNVRIRVAEDRSGVVTDGVRKSINPFDEIALEEALRIRECGLAEEVIVVSIGPPACEQQLRTGLAMGADRGILVKAQDLLDPLTVARTLKKIVEREAPFIVLMGKQSIDGDNNQTGQMLAALWQRPQATFASKIEINGNTARISREVDAGLETIEVDLPAVITTDLRLNEPRFVRLPEMMKAKRKPIDMLQLSDLDVQSTAGFRVVETRAPEARPRGVIVESAEALVGALRERGLLS